MARPGRQPARQTGVTRRSRAGCGIGWRPAAGLAWPAHPSPRGSYLAGGFFGAIYPNWEPEPFFSSLRTVAAKTGQKVCIFAAGRMGGGAAIWDRLPAAYPDVQFVVRGEFARRGLGAGEAEAGRGQGGGLQEFPASLSGGHRF